MRPPLIRRGHADGQQSLAPALRPTSKNATVHKPVMRYKKAQQAAESVHALDLLKKTYKNAIEYRTIPAQVRGLILLFGSITGGLALRGCWLFFSKILGVNGELPTFFYFLLSFVGLVALFGLLVFVVAIRMELFRPIDEPVIFDRGNRKVYHIARTVAPGFRGFFKPWPVRAYEYDWDLVDAEYQLTISTTGSTVTTSHKLLFIVKNSPADSRMIRIFQVANPVLLSETTVAPFWEHIRRFMEDDGPHLPPGETTTHLQTPTSLWQSMGVVGPFGPNYFHWWKNHPFYSVVIHLLIPFTLPVLVTWGIMNWLSYMTATKVQWPHEVENAVGPANL